MDYVSEAVKEVSKLMVLSAITAPKARGKDNLVIKVLESREELESLAKKMEELAPIYGDFFARDAVNVRQSDAVVLIGCKLIDIGLKTPNAWKADVNLACSLVNLGIAVGSAVKTASLLNVDNRVMFTAGVAAQELCLIDADVALGIPLSATAKNVYFDRRWPPPKP
ncbi:MAG: ferredoxin [Zestosphaera tikiterensis]|uniref:Ferredoxin n=1 Tax=Zestosphaera tikiterensis TaxID=1973259 RepID=A0A2R7Y6P8_9CREN|nr:MAG: ferredoxin [Zestosphaera tikiterensis]